MSGIVHHLVRRGFEETRRFQTGSEEGDRHLIPAWGAAILFGTLMTYGLVMFAIRYTYGNVVGILTMIETPTLTAFKIDGPETDPLHPSDQKDNKDMSGEEEELLIVKTKPITAKVRTTMRHLRAQAGPWSRFRGLGIYLVYQVLHLPLLSLLATLIARTSIPQSAAAVMASVALCRLDLMWVHTVISTPSTRTWRQRIPNFASVKQILLPAAMYAVVEQIAVSLPRDLFKAFGLSAYTYPGEFRKVSPDIQKQVIFQLLAVSSVGIIATFIVLLPAAATLTRVQGSLLPEEEEAIVPFDRTFGGKVEPKIVGGTGVLSMVDALKSLDCGAWVRLVKLYVKIFTIEIVTTVLFAMVGAAELKLILTTTQGSK